MKRITIAVAFALAVVAGATLTRCATANRSAAPAPDREGTAAPVPASQAPAPLPHMPSAVDATQPSTSPSTASPTPEKTGDEGLRATLRLQKPSSTAAMQMMQQYDRDEMLLIAQVTKRTNRSPSPAVGEIIERRRSGALYPELLALADQKLAGNITELLAVREWLAQYARPKGDAQGAPSPAAGGGMRLDGSVNETRPK